MKSNREQLIGRGYLAEGVEFGYPDKSFEEKLEATLQNCLLA